MGGMMMKDGEWMIYDVEGRKREAEFRDDLTPNHHPSLIFHPSS
jgi:hypothetical protein